MYAPGDIAFITALILTSIGRSIFTKGENITIMPERRPLPKAYGDGYVGRDIMSEGPEDIILFSGQKNEENHIQTMKMGDNRWI